MGAGPPLRRRAPLLLALLLVLAAPSARAQQDTGFTEIVVQVNVSGGPQTTLLGLSRDSTLLLPVRALLALVAIRVRELSPGRRLVAVLEPGDTTIGFDTERGRYRRANEELPLPPERARWVGDELYADVALLALLLDVSATTDWGELTVVLGNTERLPVVSGTLRARRRAALLGGDERRPVGAWLPAAHRVVDGFILDWGLTSATRDPLRQNGVQFGFGAQVLGGSLEVQQTYDRAPVADTAVPGRSRVRTVSDTRWQWTTAWPLRGWLRQLRLGETTTGARRAFPVRGAVISNAPYLRESSFGTEALAGQLRPGWEIESLRGEQLLAYAAVDDSGGYRLRVPVSYGPNPVNLVAYGPQGEVVRSSRTVVVPTERLPGGRFEYTVGGGRCQTSTCRTAVQGDVRYGMSSHLTVQAGADRFTRDSLPDLFHPWALVSGAPFPEVNVAVEAVGRGFVRTRADLDPSTDLHLDIGHVRFDTTVSHPLIGSASVRDQTDGSLFWRPRGPRSLFYLQGSASRSAGMGTTRDRLRLAASWQFLGVRTLLGTERLRTRSAGVAAQEQTLADVTLDGQVRSTFLRVAAGGGCGEGLLRCAPRVSVVTARVSRHLLGTVQVAVDARWTRGRRGTTVDVTFSSQGRGVRWVARNGFDRVSGSRRIGDILDGVQGTQLLEGSVLWDRHTGRLALGNGRSLGRGGLAGVVFEDRNGDGVKQPEEPGLSDILLHVGSFAVRTDSAGRFSVGDLVPFEPVTIEVDTLALDNPLWVPAEPALLTGPAPNAFGFVQVAVLNGGEVNGAVTRGDATQGLGGIPVAFRHILTGSVRTVRTFSDGSFFVGGLRPGAYDVMIPNEVLVRLQVTAAPLRISIGPSEGDNRLDGVIVRLERARP